MSFIAISWFGLLCFLAAHGDQIQALGAARSGRFVTESRTWLKSSHESQHAIANDAESEPYGQRKLTKTSRYLLQQSQRTATSLLDNATASFRTNTTSQSDVEHPEVLAIAAAAAVAAAGNRAVTAGRQIMHGSSNSKHRDIDKILQPEERTNVDDARADAGRAASSSVLVAPAAVDPAEQNSIEANASGRIPDTVLPAAHTVRKTDPFDDSSIDWVGDDLDARNEKEDVEDQSRWPSTDLVPAPRFNNESTVTPIPKQWPNNGIPTLPVLMLPLISLLLGLTCLCALFVLNNTEGGESFFDRRSRAVAFHSFQSKTDAVFNAIDQDRDGFVSLSELRSLAQLTNPKSARRVTMDWFRDLCRPLGADPERGLDRQTFRQTYMLLGSDVDTDFAAVSNEVDPPHSSTSGTGPAASLLESSRENVQGITSSRNEV